jgi:predicted metal-dependent hydrolase
MGMNLVSQAPVAAVPTVRTPRFELPDRIDTGWNPTFPEFAAAANAVSLLMPHVEPYVAQTVRSVLDQLDGPLAEQATAFVAQELQHQAQHRRVNQLVLEGAPGLRRVDRWAARAYGWLARTRSTRWSLAFAAGFETSAFALARWTEGHLRLLFDGADPAVSTLFIWHLAEEVEHKTVAFDVQQAVDGSRRRYLAAGLCSLAMLAWFTVLGTVVQLAASRRIWSPVSWWRLLRWSISLAFEVLPDLFVSATPRHHPSQFSDPSLLVTWLASFDPSTGKDPLHRR